MRRHKSLIRDASGAVGVTVVVCVIPVCVCVCVPGFSPISCFNVSESHKVRPNIYGDYFSCAEARCSDQLQRPVHAVSGSAVFRCSGSGVRLGARPP